MKTIKTPLLVLGLLGATGIGFASGGGSTTETFEGGTNAAGWSFIPGSDVIETSGGNPGAWLHNDQYDTFAPMLTTDDATPSAFVGDYRALGVTSISLDARTDANNFGAVGFEMSLLLRDTKGTVDVNDDDYAYFVGPNVPLPGNGWEHYDFAIPSSSTDPVPAGWSGGWVGDPENFRPGVDWNDVIQSVDRVEIWWLNPSFFAIFQQWDVGADNITITTGGGGASASVTVRNGGGFNPQGLSSVNLPMPGAVWQVSLDCSANAPAMAAFGGWPAASSGSFIDAGEVLVDLASPRIFLRQVPHAGGTATVSVSIPNTTAVCGLEIFTQGACYGSPGPQLTNALDAVIGQ